MNSIGEKIKEARKAKGLTQDELAKRLGVNRVAISNYEKGKNNPTHENLIKLSDILDVQLLESAKNIYKTVPFLGSSDSEVPQGKHNMTIKANIGVDDRIYKDGMYAIEATNDAMSPKINSGNVVYCSPRDFINSGDIVHYSVNGESGIRKYCINEAGTVVALIPINPEFDIKTLDEYDIVNLKISKVVGAVDTNF